MKTWLSLAATLLVLTACGPRSEEGPLPAPPAATAPGGGTPVAAATEAPPSPAGSAAAEIPVPAPKVNGVQELAMQVTTDGFVPRLVALEAGVPARLLITRKTDSTCATEIQSPELGLATTKLPLDQETAVEFTPSKEGRHKFGCGMDMMISGWFVVSPSGGASSQGGSPVPPPPPGSAHGNPAPPPPPGAPPGPGQATPAP